MQGSAGQLCAVCAAAKVHHVPAAAESCRPCCKHMPAPLLHVRQEFVKLPKLLKVNCAAASLVMYADDVSYCGQAEVQVAKLQRCLQLHCCKFIVAILVNSIEPLYVAVRT
jgi:hypothetical protein